MSEYIEENALDLKELFMMLWRNIYIIIVITLLCSILVTLYSTYFIEKQYQSNTLFAITLKDGLDSSNSDDLRVTEELAERYSLIAESNAVLESVQIELEIEHGVSLSKSQIKNSFTISANRAIIQLIVKIDDPDLARILVNLLTDKSNEIYQNVFKTESVEIIDYGIVNDVPVSPNIKLNIVIGFVLGMMISVGIILLKELINRKILTSKDLEDLGIPYLGSVLNLSKYTGQK